MNESYLSYQIDMCMYYQNKSPSLCQIYTFNSYEDFPNNEMYRCKISKMGSGTRCCRYKTTVSSATEKLSKIVDTETDMVCFDSLLFTYKYCRVNQI